MKSYSILKTALGLCLFFGTGLAQPILTSYQNATEALRLSVAAFPDDQVESLDALRRAATAFEPLGAVLEPTLRRGLNETFNRAEEAIVNQSETDLQVQAAVLQGGFGRAVYQQALERAANGDSASAQNLLGVLGQDLGLADAQFAGESQDALQGAFEARLAARGLEELGAFGGDLGSRYRTLAQLYGYIFLVQDSPRLPPKTRDTVVGTIRSLVAERPTDEGINLLKAQLTGFAGAAERAEVGAAQTQGGDGGQGGAQNAAAPGAASAGAATPATPSSEPEAETIRSSAASSEAISPEAASPGTNDDAFVPPVALTPGDVLSGDDATDEDVIPSGVTSNSAANDSAVNNDVADSSAADNGATSSAQPASSDPSAEPTPPGTAQSSTVQNSAAQDSTASATLGDAAVPGTTPALPFLTPDVWALLLAAAGLFALIGIVQLLVVRSLLPWRDAALTLLLLPVVLEGLVAAAGLLRPFVNQPWLAQLGPYSLFTHPLTQLAWLLLSAVAALCLVFSWRANRRALAGEKDEPEYAQIAPRPDAPPPTRSTPLTTGNLNWDEDF